jgi:hypothetical protein
MRAQRRSCFSDRLSLLMRRFDFDLEVQLGISALMSSTDLVRPG